MPRKATAADSDNTVKEELPTCSGAHLEFAQWFRDLLHYSYLFEADVAFFLASGSGVTNNTSYASLSRQARWWSHLCAVMIIWRTFSPNPSKLPDSLPYATR